MNLLTEWGIGLRFRAAYAPSGNGIVERNHRTIKRVVARGGITPEEAVFWYNATPRQDIDHDSVPAARLFKYTWRLPYKPAVQPGDTCTPCRFHVGDEVWVKPHPPICDRPWVRGVITGIQSAHTVCVDGMPRHVRDIRKRRGENGAGVPVAFPPEDRLGLGPYALHRDQDEVNEEADIDDDDVRYDVPLADPQQDNVVQRPVEDRGRLQGAGNENCEPAPEVPLRRSTRVRFRPAYLQDYETGENLDAV